VCALHCAQLLHTILHRTDLIVFPLTLQTITTSPMMSIWGKGRKTAVSPMPHVPLWFQLIRDHLPDCTLRSSDKPPLLVPWMATKALAGSVPSLHKTCLQQSKLLSLFIRIWSPQHLTLLTVNVTLPADLQCMALHYASKNFNKRQPITYNTRQLQESHSNLRIKI